MKNDEHRKIFIDKIIILILFVKSIQFIHLNYRIHLFKNNTIQKIRFYCVGSIILPINKTQSVCSSLIMKVKGRSKMAFASTTTPLLVIMVMAVTAAASVPFSFTLIRVKLMTITSFIHYMYI